MPTTSAASKRASMTAASAGRKSSTASKRHSMIINPNDIPTSASPDFDFFLNGGKRLSSEHSQLATQLATALKLHKSSAKKVNVDDSSKKMISYSDQRAEFRHR